MIDLLQFGDKLVSKSEQSQASVVYKDGDIWHKLYISPTTQNITQQVYTKLQIL